MPEFCQGHEVKFEVRRSECIKDFSVCTPAQKLMIEQMMMMGRFSFVVFSTEVFLDFDDFDAPIKSRTKIIEARDARIVDGDFNWTLDYKIDLHVNQAQLSDNPYQNPFEEKPDSEWEYLTIDKFSAIH